ncbi:MAG: TonB-dependent receptor [Verrucomicrobiota bacterium]|nr:TonB-dependent receptor [Verrucomicrobiota bacterium]
MLNKLGFVRSALVVGVGIPFLAAAGAFAQGTAPGAPRANTAPVPDAPVPAAATTERVIVTGSYIPTAETESALPVTVYTAEVLQKQGAQTPVEGLRQLPSFVGNASTENDSNGGNGQAGINLRSIGQQNVLVLINGRRAFLGTGLNLQADINAIPISAIARTEVLKDGASAIYGSDAVAGVVNFVLLNGPGEAPYEGAEINLLYGNTSETDAHVRQAYIRAGVKTDKVAVAASAEYYSRANLFSRDRAQLAGTGDLSNNPAGLGRGGLNNNSPTFPGRVSVLTGTTAAGAGPFPLTGQLVLLNPTTNQVNPASYRRFDVPAGTDPRRFNFRNFTPAIPAVEKFIYYVTGRYKVFGDGLQIYGDVMYANTKQDNGLAPAPFSISNTANGIADARVSPFNPFGDRLSSVRYRLVQELGNRRSFYDHDYWRYVVGANGDFNLQGNGFISRFGYDTGFVYEKFDERRTDSGDATRTRIRALILKPPGTTVANTSTFNPFIGLNAPPTGFAPTYVNGVPTGLTRPYNNLVAGNLFTNANAPGAAYVGNSLFRERDWLADVKLNAHFFPNLYNGGIDLAAGYEHRELNQHSIPDNIQAANDQLGFNQAPNTETQQRVDSIFAELNFPIVTSTMNIPFVRSFEISAAFRYEKFHDRDQFTHNTASFDNSNPDEDFGGTPRLSIRYQPIPDLTLRANFNQSFRSPSPNSLFAPVTQNFPQLFDPVIKVTLQPPDGVSQSGNSATTPELTDAYSAGLVYTPKWLPGFTITADFYQLYTKNLILGAADFAQVLLSTNTPDPDGPILEGGGPGLGITRNPDGTLRTIDSAVGNAGARLVEGLDVTAVYEIPTQNFGTFTFSGGWNHFFIWKAGLGIPGFELHNFLGDYNNGTFPLAPGAVPFNKAFLRGEWTWKGFDLVGTGNYIGDYEDDPNFIFGNDVVGPQPGTGGTLANPNFILHHRVSDYITLDMQLSYEFKKPQMEPAAAGYSKDAKDGKNAMSQVAGVENNGSIWQRMLWGTKITVGCNNIFDRYPPTVLGAFNDNYDTSNYSIRNRFYYIGLNKKF